jgi:retron-type reverse transcriptase
MIVGDMQRKLSHWAAQDKARQFYDLYDFLYDQDWLRLAHDHVKHNAGRMPAGCDKAWRGNARPGRAAEDA